MEHSTKTERKRWIGDLLADIEDRECYPDEPTPICEAAVPIPESVLAQGWDDTPRR